MIDEKEKTDNKKRMGNKGQSVILISVAVIFLIGSYLQIVDHYSKIEESKLSLTIVILAVLIAILAIMKLFHAIRLIINR